MPAPFVRAASSWLGDEAPAFLAACARPPRLAIRAHGNTLRGGMSALRDTLAALGIDTTTWPAVPWWPAALLPPTEEGARLAAHPLARVGALYAQDPAALAAVAVLDPQPGERVLDLCAAPGGKSTAIADRLAGRGLLVANDVDAGRARELGRTLERWGVANAAVLSVAPEELAARAPALFDRVLVDAPCSGEAMFGRHAAAAADWSPAHVAGCAARQRPLLDAARALARPGGLLVYSTCTFNPEEDERVVAAYLAAHPGDTLEDAVERVPGASPGRPDLAALAEPGPGSANNRPDGSAAGLSGGAGVSPVPGLTLGRASSATSATRPQDNLSQTLELGTVICRPGGTPAPPYVDDNGQSVPKEVAAGDTSERGHPNSEGIGGALTRCARLWPHRTVGMGHFVATIRVSVVEDGQPQTVSARTRPIARESDRTRGIHTGDSLARKSPGSAGTDVRGVRPTAPVPRRTTSWPYGRSSWPSRPASPTSRAAV